MKEALITVLDKMTQAVNTDLNRAQPDVVSARLGLIDAMGIVEKLIPGAPSVASTKKANLPEHAKAKTVRAKPAESGGDPFS